MCRSVASMLIYLLLLACTRDDVDADADGCERPEHADFDASATTWKQLAADNGNTYYYSYRSSGFTGLDEEPPDGGCTDTYTVQVIDGEVSRRTRVSAGWGSTPINACGAGWVEEGEAVGSHDAPLQAWTMDQHYQLCCDTVLVQDPDDNHLYFSTFDNGVMRGCSYAPSNCAELCDTASDDYPYGIRFSDFGFGHAP